MGFDVVEAVRGRPFGPVAFAGARGQVAAQWAGMAAHIEDMIAADMAREARECGHVGRIPPEVYHKGRGYLSEGGYALRVLRMASWVDEFTARDCARYVEGLVFVSARGVVAGLFERGWLAKVRVSHDDPGGAVSFYAITDEGRAALINAVGGSK